MNNNYEVSGTYGSGKTPCTVFVSEQNDGLKWYVAEGSVNVNATYDEISDGVNIEELSDVDIFTWPKGVHSLEELENAIND